MISHLQPHSLDLQHPKQHLIHFSSSKPYIHTSSFRLSILVTLKSKHTIPHAELVIPPCFDLNATEALESETVAGAIRGIEAKDQHVRAAAVRVVFHATAHRFPRVSRELEMPAMTRKLNTKLLK